MKTALVMVAIILIGVGLGNIIALSQTSDITNEPTEGKRVEYKHFIEGEDDKYRFMGTWKCVNMGVCTSLGCQSLHIIFYENGTYFNFDANGFGGDHYGTWDIEWDLVNGTHLVLRSSYYDKDLRYRVTFVYDDNVIVLEGLTNSFNPIYERV